MKESRPFSWSTTVRVLLLAMLTTTALHCSRCKVPTNKLAANVSNVVTSASDDPHTEKICPRTRWVGEATESGVCKPGTGGWKGGKMFEATGPKLPKDLAGFCLYEWTGTVAPADSDLAKLPKDGGRPPKDWLDRDCMAVAALTPTGANKERAAEATVFASLEKNFLAQVEAPTSLPAFGNQSEKVSVAIVDSWPLVRQRPSMTVDPPGRLRHGLAMGQIVERVSCVGATCAATVTRHLALNRMPNGQVDELRGGYYSYQGHLAVTIFTALKIWQQKAPNSRLIINLSLGWDGRFNGTGTTLSAPVRAVRAAIRHAVCQGALVIAAAGNATGGPKPGEGLMYPAAWTTEQAPPTCMGIGPQTPLVWAVGGVDGTDRPLRNTRPTGRPELAAYAFAVPTIYDEKTPPLRTPPATGTSVAAAVATGIASLVWRYQPTYSARQVMELVRSSGVKLGKTADACLGGACRKIRRISACRAVEAASGGGVAVPCMKIASGAGKQPRCSTQNLKDIVKNGVFLHNAKELTNSVKDSRCSAPVKRKTTTAPSNACPSELKPNYLLVHGVSPQPGHDPCGVCFGEMQPVQNVMLLAIGVHHEMAGQQYPVLLQLHDTRGRIVEQFYLADLFPGGLAPGSMNLVEEIPVGRTAFHYASIVWEDSRTHTASEIPVWR